MRLRHCLNVGRCLLGAVVLFVFGSLTLTALDGPVPAPVDRFGARGDHEVIVETFPSPSWSGQVVTVLHPAGEPEPRPVWFFAHGFAGHDPVYYEELLQHLASHGFVVVFVPYPAQLLQVAQNYETLFDGFAEAEERYRPWIDASRVGFAGHSYGGGAVPALALRGLRENGWGKNGLALLVLAPWYSFGVSNADLASFPAHTQVVVQIYEDDLINDHRMAVDLFTHLTLPDAQKDFLMVRSDRIEGHNYVAGHHVPTGRRVPRPGAAYDALDTWTVHRLTAALGASAQQGDQAGREIALGDGSAAQTRLGRAASGRELRPMIQLDEPVAVYPEERYLQAFGAALNPRRHLRPPERSRGAHLANLSARARTAAPAHPLIVGAVVHGDRPKSLLIRAAGPALRSQGVAQPLEDPALTVYRGPSEDIAIDDWADAIDLETLRMATEETGAFVWPERSRDAALLASFDAGAITAHAAGPSNSEGVVLLEVFDGDVYGGTELRNLSARAWVGAGEDVLIGGFVVRGPAPLRLLLRGIGPALEPFGVPEVVSNPALTLHDRDGAVLAENHNWSDDPARTPALVEAMAQTGAFALASGSLDAALLVDVAPGAYTVQLRSEDGAVGTGLLEIYVVSR